jgi:hypothetical protein
MRHNQNRRSRGRSRKGPNPLTRSYESNGPDVKVRGTAVHVADKYMTLARDALSAGDTVSAENYLQHAEHYNRIVMAAQAQFQPSQPQFREGGEEGYDDDRHANGRPRDRFDSNGDGRGEGEGDDQFEGGDGGDDRGGYRARRPDDQDRQREPRQSRPDDQDRQREPRQSRDEGRNRPKRDEQQAGYQAGEPQPEVAAATDEKPSQPRRRRRAPKTDGEGADAQDAGDSTPDGAAALAAFPE